jgi:outer membrane biosynthesis protein TonB
VIVVFAACAAAVALPAGLAESATASPGNAPSSSGGPIISVTLCTGGLNVGVLGIGVTIGQTCPPWEPTASPSPTSTAPVDICTLPPPPSSPPPTPTPRPTPLVTKPKPSPTPTPKAAVVVPAPPSPSFSPAQIPAAVIKPKPKPTPAKPTPKPPSTPVAAQLPQAYHAAVPFRRLSPVLILFVVAIVPVSLARIRHSGGRSGRRR